MKRNSDNVNNIYEIQIPNFDSTTTRNFNFNARLGNNLFTFYFIYNTSVSRWSGWVVLPDLSIRLIGVIPMLLNWSRYIDYSLFFNFNGQNIELSDLVNSTIVLLEWSL
jgi:hypothetical protein